MKTTLCALTVLWASTSLVLAQEKPATGPGGHEPPQQAYADCAGKKAGDKIEHTTPEGRVPATCENSPKGLVARPLTPKPNSPDSRSK
jgi:hypothetical protein